MAERRGEDYRVLKRLERQSTMETFVRYIILSTECALCTLITTVFHEQLRSTLRSRVLIAYSPPNFLIDCEMHKERRLRNKNTVAWTPHDGNNGSWNWAHIVPTPSQVNHFPLLPVFVELSAAIPRHLFHSTCSGARTLCRE